MKSMRLALMGALLAFGIGACGGGADEWKGKYQKIIDEMCACKDEACADKVNESRKTLRKEFKEAFKDKKEEAKKIGEEMQDLDKKYRECRDKARAGGGDEAKTE